MWNIKILKYTKNPHKLVTHVHDVISTFSQLREYSYDAWLQLPISNRDSSYHVATPIIRVVIE